MFPRVTLTRTDTWQQLLTHFDLDIKGTHLRELFQSDPERFKKFSLLSNGILFDYSKNIITEKTIGLLLRLCEECKVKDAIEAMFAGEKINQTEERSVLHIALRNNSGQPVYSEGKDVMPEVKRVQKQMESFCRKIHSGEWRGYSGKKIKYIVNIGIGGSEGCADRPFSHCSTARTPRSA